MQKDEVALKQPMIAWAALVSLGAGSWQLFTDTLGDDVCLDNRDSVLYLVPQLIVNRLTPPKCTGRLGS